MNNSNKDCPFQYNNSHKTMKKQHFKTKPNKTAKTFKLLMMKKSKKQLRGES